MNANVEITAYWGNDDAESTIIITEAQWALIQSGASFELLGSSYYEGEQFKVRWRFANGKVDVDDEECRSCLVDTPISDLSVQLL